MGGSKQRIGKRSGGMERVKEGKRERDAVSWRKRRTALNIPGIG